MSNIKSNLEILCGGEYNDCAVTSDPILLRLLGRLGNGRRKSDARSFDDVLCLSADAPDVRPTSTPSSENRLPLDRCLPWLVADIRPPESAREANVRMELFEERRCAVACCSNSGVTRAVNATLALSTFCCSSLERERATERRSPADDDRDTELTSAKSPDDNDCTERFVDIGLSISSCVSYVSSNFCDVYKFNHILQRQCVKIIFTFSHWQVPCDTKYCTV